MHLAVGLGYYHHLILSLQSEYDLDLVGIIDFAFTHFETTSSYVSMILNVSVLLFLVLYIYIYIF